MDVDWSLSHLCPPCPVKLQWKSLDFLKHSAVSQLLLGLCPMCFTHNRHFSKSKNTRLGGQCIKRAKPVAAKDLLEVMEQRRKVTKIVGRVHELVHGVWAESGSNSRTVVGTRLVSLQQRSMQEPEAPLCQEGQPSDHRDTSCTRRQCHLHVAPSSSLSLGAGATGGGGSMEWRGVITSPTASCYFDSSITVI